MERGLISDRILRFAIRKLLSRRLQEVTATNCEQQQQQFEQFLEMARSGPVADVPQTANEQHYEVPTEFFQLVLGKRLKYSCCRYPDAGTTLDQAEIAALAETCEHAQLTDGLDILELGCGWGSLSLWMAESYPHSRITAVSNSRTQREYILNLAEERSLHNLTVLTADMNDFRIDRQFDRVVSVEMFEHMRNHEELMRRISGWLKPDGKLFVHIFCHREIPYLFETDGDADWMARYFFTGGMMPSDDLLMHYSRDLRLAEQWRWEGTHYERTCNHWLQNMDANRERIMNLFEMTYRTENAVRWWNRWRVFFISCAELFGYRDGQEWWVSHYLFEKQMTHVDHQTQHSDSFRPPE
jgi:cyclopropane-fatty-acyl-phospholipid synthase